MIQYDAVSCVKRNVIMYERERHPRIQVNSDGRVLNPDIHNGFTWELTDKTITLEVIGKQSIFTATNGELQMYHVQGLYGLLFTSIEALTKYYSDKTNQNEWLHRPKTK